VKVTLLAVSDVVYQAIIAAVVVLVPAYFAHRAAERAKVAAVKVDEVKQDLQSTDAKQDAKLDEITKTGDAIHTLVNSAMGQQLKVAAVALRRIADITKHPDDAAAAELAEKGLREHEVKQQVVDSGDKIAEAGGPGER
jgi:hypothetical protein